MYTPDPPLPPCLVTLTTIIHSAAASPVGRVKNGASRQGVLPGVRQPASSSSTASSPPRSDQLGLMLAPATGGVGCSGKDGRDSQVAALGTFASKRALAAFVSSAKISSRPGMVRPARQAVAQTH